MRVDRPERRKEFCGRGLHRMEGRNVFIKRNGKRNCRACLNNMAKERYRELFHGEEALR